MQRMTITALHNHWLFSEPGAMYMHFESAQDAFARKAAAAFRVVKRIGR
ncbi:DUF1259 domain-containing protein [Bacillus subtilis]